MINWALALVALLAANSANAAYTYPRVEAVQSGAWTSTVNGSTVAVQCLNAAGTAFESCGGSSSANAIQTVTVAVDSFSLTNAGYVRFPSAQTVNVQLSPSNIDTGKGAAGTYTQRVAVASDNPAQTITVAVDSFSATNPAYVRFNAPQAYTVNVDSFSLSNPGYVRFPSAQTVSVQLSPSNIDTGKGAVGTYTQRIAVASDNPAQTVTVAVDSFTASNPAFVRFNAAQPFTVAVDSFAASNPGYVRFNAPQAFTVNVDSFSSTNPGFVRFNAPQTVTVNIDSTTLANPTHVRVENSTMAVVNSLGAPFRVTGTVDIDSFSFANAGWLNVKSGTVAVIGVQGSSIAVYQSVQNSFLAFSTASLSAGATHFVLMNHPGSTVVIKIRHIEAQGFFDTNTAGAVTNLWLHEISSHTGVVGAGASSSVQTRRADTALAALNASVVISTGGNLNIPTFVTGPPLVSAVVNSSSAVQGFPVILYDWQSVSGETPLTLRAGQGISIRQSPAPNLTTGKVAISARFTQE